jgi:signal transduction histidine kinase
VQQQLASLRAEVDELRASRRRLVLAADADRRRIERGLHGGVHQYLVALAMSLQLVEQAAGSDPGPEKALLEEMGRDVHAALDETARLAQRIHPPTLEARDLATLLRSAATGAGVPAAVDVSAGASYPPEVVMTVYVCWLDTIERAGGETRARIDVREGDDALTFEIVGSATRSHAELDHLRDRVEALGGTLTISSGPAGGGRLCGSLPLSGRS